MRALFEVGSIGANVPARWLGRDSRGECGALGMLVLEVLNHNICLKYEKEIASGVGGLHLGKRVTGFSVGWCTCGPASTARCRRDSRISSYLEWQGSRLGMSPGRGPLWMELVWRWMVRWCVAPQLYGLRATCADLRAIPSTHYRGRKPLVCCPRLSRFGVGDVPTVHYNRSSHHGQRHERNLKTPSVVQGTVSQTFNSFFSI